jgi:hypothetical protein
MAHARRARAGRAGRGIRIGRRWAVVFLPTLQACDGEHAHLRERITAGLGALDRASLGLQNCVGVGGYDGENLGGYEGGRRRAFGSGELRGGEREALGEEGVMLLSVVVLSRARGAAYIGCSEG